MSRNPRPIKTRAVDDHLRLSDSKLTVDVYRVVSNNHMAHGLMAYVPEHRLLIQGDLFDVNWEVYFWGNTYEDNVAYRKLDVERDVPIHGRVLPIAEVRAKLAEQTRNAEQLCARVEIGRAFDARLPARVGRLTNRRAADSTMRPFRSAASGGARRLRLAAMAAIAMVALQGTASASPEAERLMDDVARAMGGAEAILGIRTLQADGYGMEAYFWGGGNVTADPDAPQKWAENPNFSSIWDFANDRYRTQYRHNFLFPFGGTFGHSFSLSSWGVDGDVGYTISPAGAGTRLADWTTGGAWFKPDGTIFRTYESLSHPLAAVRAVLSRRRRSGEPADRGRRFRRRPDHRRRPRHARHRAADAVAALGALDGAAPESRPGRHHDDVRRLPELGRRAVAVHLVVAHRLARHADPNADSRRLLHQLGQDSGHRGARSRARATAACRHRRRPRRSR